MSTIPKYNYVNNEVSKQNQYLTSNSLLKRQANFVADNIHFFIYLFILFCFVLFFFSEKTSLDISLELSAKQTIHMKCQDLFSLKIKMLSAAVVIGALRINI